MVPIAWNKKNLPVVIVFTLALLACASRVDKPAQENEVVSPPPAETPQAQVPQAAVLRDAALPVKAPPARRIYEVDPAASEVRILVYRTGRLSHLWQNHVISSHDVQGQVVLADEITRSSVDLKIPVATLVVDDPKDNSEDF